MAILTALTALGVNLLLECIYASFKVNWLLPKVKRPIKDAQFFQVAIGDVVAAPVWDRIELDAV